jgi:UMF1 family MFS transporter
VLPGSGGTLMMSVVAGTTGDPRLGILIIAVLFVAGALLLTRVDVASGERAARDAERAAGLPEVER